MNERPDEEGPVGWGDIRLLCRTVDISWTSNSVYVGTKEEEEYKNVYNLNGKHKLVNLGIEASSVNWPLGRRHPQPQGPMTHARKAANIVRDVLETQRD